MICFIDVNSDGTGGEFEVRCLPGIMTPDVRMGLRGLLIAAGSTLMGTSWTYMSLRRLGVWRWLRYSSTVTCSSSVDCSARKKRYPSPRKKCVATQGRIPILCPSIIAASRPHLVRAKHQTLFEPITQRTLLSSFIRSYPLNS